MALNVTTLRDAIKANIVGCYGLPDDDAKLTCFCQAIADAVVAHITANAEVLPGSFTSPSGAVTGIGVVT